MTPRALFWAVFLPLAAWGHWGALSYLLRNPSSLGRESALALGAMLLRAAAALWLLGAARAAGRAALRPLRLPREDAESFVLEAGAGLGLLSLLLFALGLLGLWTRPVFVALLALGLYPAWRALPRPRLPAFAGRLEALLAVPIALAALSGFIASNAPAAEWDSLAFHLALPQAYARAGELLALTDRLHGLEPLAAGLFHVPAIALGDESAGQVAMLLFQWLMALSLWAAGRARFGGRAALPAAGLFLVSPAVTEASGNAGADFAVGLWAMLSFWAAWRGRERGGAWLPLSGALGGFAASSKTSGIMLATALFPLVLLDARRRGRPAEAAAWLAACVAAAAPWLLRAAYHTGNPLFPYFAALFGGDERALWLDERARRAVIAGWEHVLAGAWPLLVPLLALGLASRREAAQDPFARRVAAYAALFGLSWAASQPLWRYTIPTLPWLYALASGWAFSRGPALLLAAGFLPALGLGANNEAFAAFGLRPSDGRSPREAYLARRVDVWPALERVNRTLPPEARVLLYREVRGYHLERPYLLGDPQNESRVPYERLADAAALRRHLLSLGLTHVLVNLRAMPFVPLPEFLRADALMAETLRRHAELVWDDGGVRLYRLRPL